MRFLHTLALMAVGGLLLAGAGMTGGPGLTTSGPAAQPPRVSRDTFLVKFAPQVSARQIASVMAKEKVQVLGLIPHISYHVLRSPDHRAVELVGRFRAMPGVLEACPDRVYLPAYEPNDPLWPQQWGPRKIEAPACWDTQRGDPRVIIAILDTGVDYNHPDLVANIWRNQGEIPDNGLDDDGNGYIDDTRGWDFAYNDNDPLDDHGHGTFCAGIAAAVGDNSIGVCGIAPKCTIMPVKIGLSSGYMYDSMIVPGIVYAADNGARVLSMSFFSDGVTPALQEAIDYAWSKGVAPIAAAGNGYTVVPYYPAGYDNCIAVAAAKEDDARADFSTFGSWVDIIAPGVNIASTARGGSYTTASGTSAACPHAAGVAALLFSEYPTASNRWVRYRLEHFSDPVTDPLVGEYVNYGRLNAHNAVTGPSDGASFTEPKIRFVSPCQTSPGTRITIFGRCLKPLIDPPYRPPGAAIRSASAAFPVVRVGGARARVLEWREDRIVVLVPPGLPPGPAPVSATLGSAASNTLMIEVLAPDAAPVLAPTDVATGYGKSPFGETYDLIHKRDGRSVRLTLEGQDSLATMYVFRNVPLTGDHVTFSYTRTYQITAARASEVVYIYDFSESYPYGSWGKLLSSSIEAGVEKTDTVTIPLDGSWGKCISDQGDIYLWAYVNRFGNNDVLLVDHMGVEVP
jgi:hypothetical protein